MSNDPRAEDEARATAARISAHLDSIRKVVRDSIWAQARRYPVPLTAPQLLALQTLVDELRETGAGLSLSELSRRMGLAHSTVSGIVTRLETRNLLVRSTGPNDRRFVQIELTGPVKEWLDRELPAARRGPLVEALSRASESERALILEGVETLDRILRT